MNNKTASVEEEASRAVKIYELLQPLSHQGRSRVMDYVIDRMEEERDTPEPYSGGPPK